MTDEILNPDDPKHFRHATLHWEHDTVFRGGPPGGQEIVTDGRGDEGPDMVVLLLLAAGGCAGADVVSILKKMQAGLESLRIEVSGRRNPEPPKRYNHLTLRFVMRGSALTEANTARAVELSVSKYCSVLRTLDPEMPVDTEIVIES
jgi:putative redox protein